MRGQTGMVGNEYADGMVEHDGDVGELLKALDDLGIADNTIVVYTTDNGPNQWSWPDGATTPFRGEKETNWEGAFRVPAMIRWPGQIKPGKVSNEMFSGLDWFPTLLAAAGDAEVKDKLLKGWQPAGKTIQESSRRLQPARLPHGQDAEERAHGFLLFQRRRRSGGDAVRRLEGRLRRAAQAGTIRWSGPIPSRRCACPSCSTCGWIRIERADIVSDQLYDFFVKNDYLAGEGAG